MGLCLWVVRPSENQTEERVFISKNASTLTVAVERETKNHTGVLFYFFNFQPHIFDHRSNKATVNFNRELCGPNCILPNLYGEVLTPQIMYLELRLSGNN